MMRHDAEKLASFSERLKRILQERDLSQLAVMRATGLSQQAISGWCRGLHLPRGVRLQTLADFLDMEPRELCPEAFDDTAVQVAQSGMSFNPVAGQPGWFILRCQMPIDAQMLADVLAANTAFEKRQQEEGFDDFKLAK